MAHVIHRLKAIELEHLAKRPGMHHDGGGLYLCAKDGAKASWLYRYMFERRPRAMGLGGYPAVSLAKARKRADAARELLKAEGKDPIAERKAERTRARLEAAKAVTFKQCAAAYIALQQPGWKHEKQGKLWANTLAAYAYPVLGDLPVQSIDTGLVLKVLQPIWYTKPETAGRVRQRIESILGYAKVSGYRDGDNPALWDDHLEKVLPAQSKVRPLQHFAALPYKDHPAFMTALRNQDGIAAKALEFLILTAARTGEVIGARWEEIDTKEKVWNVPADRTKTGKEHRVPLSKRALVLLGETGEGFIFPGAKAGKPISNMAMLKLLERMGRSDLTVHGFRSTFRDWAAEQTAFPNEVVEMALAHAVANKVEAAYRRGDLFDKRRRLMDVWAEYCSRQPAAADANVIPMREAVS